jgi:serine/threonine protein kinase
VRRRCAGGADNKPANIFLLEQDGKHDFVKIVDFGLATARPLMDASQARDSLEELRDNALTQAGALMGTPLYMSPEQIQGPAVDARTDQYALFCTDRFPRRKMARFRPCGSIPGLSGCL